MISRPKPPPFAPGTRLRRAIVLTAGWFLLLSGCGDGDPGAAGGESPAARPAEAGSVAVRPAAKDSKVATLVEAVLDAYGGREALENVEAYRCEGLITAAQWPEQGETVRWFEHPDRLRIEMRHRDRGDLRIVRGRQGWTGADDRSLVPLGNEFFRSTYLQAVRMALPLRLAEDLDAVAELAPDEKGRRVLRLTVGQGLSVDCHIEEKTARIEAVTLNMLDPEPAVITVELSEFRRVEGVLFPFREDAYADGAKTATVRFRTVAVNPITPVLLFAPDGDF